MKTRDEVQEEFPSNYVFTIDEFIEAYDADAFNAYNYDAWGYYHDGEDITDKTVWLNREDILDHKKTHPYIIWTEF